MKINFTEIFENMAERNMGLSLGCFCDKPK